LSKLVLLSSYRQLDSFAIVGDIQTIGTGQIRVISITYLRLTYSCDRDNYLQNSPNKI